jgi:hypothetical protein
MIERRFAERVELDKATASEIARINDEEGIKWLFSFLSADKFKSYCLYEALNAEAIRVARAPEHSGRYHHRSGRRAQARDVRLRSTFVRSSIATCLAQSTFAPGEMVAQINRAIGMRGPP